MSQYFFTSDTHYSHTNLVTATSKWPEGGDRDFESLEAHNLAIVRGINRIVGPDDILIHDGDWSFGGTDQIYEFRRQIKCKTIHLVLGNHDEHIEKNKNLGNCIQKVGDRGIPYFDYAYTHDSVHDTVAKPQDLFASVSQRLSLKVNGQRMEISHYAQRVWDKIGHGAWMLYGHSHGSMEHTPYGKSMDIGMDHAFKLFGEYRPFSFEELKAIMDDRPILKVDHHDNTKA
jgi:calcineurin-like phosphoesterase family protein